MDFASIIKRSVYTKSAFYRYGINIDGKGFSCCPFHHEKTPSLKVYEKEKGFHCFGCGESGDVISFVQKYFNLSFKEALQKINIDFGLGLDIDGKPTRGMMQNAAKQEFFRKREEQRKAQEKAVFDAEYFDLLDMLEAARENVRTMRPKNRTETPSQVFLLSLAMIDRIQNELDYIEEKRAKQWMK